MRSAAYKKTEQQVPSDPVGVSAAVEWVKSNAHAKFDETIELHVRLNVDPSRSEHMVRGVVSLPGGAPKKKLIAVITADKDKQAGAKDAGASIVGGEELLSEIEANGGIAAEMVIASPDMMTKIARVANILGPKGLMPNPKNNTVAPDVVDAVKRVLAGSVTFKMDKLGNIHEPVGKISWDDKNIAANIEAFLQAISDARPPAHKGTLIGSVTLCSTMGPSVQVSV